jgi:nucleoside-diphosphate-sugar epimerase
MEPGAPRGAPNPRDDGGTPDSASAARPLRVLVTGASGFVGGALLQRLRHDPRYAVIGVGRRPIDDPLYRSIDLAAPDAGARLDALGFVPDVIVHAAARSSPWGTKAEFERDNVQVTRTILDFARRAGTAAARAEAASAAAAARTTGPRIVFVSTASVLYRAADQLDVADDAPAGRPFVNHYVASKFSAEQLVRAHPGEWTVLRPRAVFGPGDTTVFPRVLAAAERGRLPEFRAPVLSDLIYIDTLVDYLERALTAPGVPGQTITLTNGEPVDLQATVRSLLLRAGVPLPRRRVSRRGALWAATVVEGLWRLARRAGEPPITRYSVIVYAYSKTFDPALCRRLLGAPSVTVADGLERYATTLEERVR